MSRLLQFKNGVLTEKYNDQDIIEFHKLGIVLKISSSRSQLCTGLISELLEEVLSAKPSEAIVRERFEDTTSHEKILFICSSPRDTNPFDFGKEYKRIKDALFAGRKRDEYIFLLETGVIKSELLKVLMHHQPSILHISMHCSNKDGLFFEGPAGDIQPMSAEEFKKVIEMYARKYPIRLITLSACNSLEHAIKAKPYCTYAMGTRTSIPERASVLYAEGFYSMLFNEGAADMLFCHEAGILAIEQASPLFKKIGDFEVKDIPQFIIKDNL